MQQRYYAPKTYAEAGYVSVTARDRDRFGESAKRQFRLCGLCHYGSCRGSGQVMICNHRRKKGDVDKDMNKNRPCGCCTAYLPGIKYIYK